MMQFDCSKELMDFRFAFQNMPMWPLIRWSFFWQAIKEGVKNQAHAAPGPGMTAIAKAAYALTAWRHRPSKDPRQFDILWFGSAAGVVAKKEGKWFGRVNDYLVGELPDRTLLIEDSHGRPMKTPRFVENIRFHDFIRIRSAILARTLKRSPREDAATIAAFVAFLRKGFFLSLEDAFYATLEKTLLDLSARLPHYHESYSRLYERTRPKVVFLEDGCYGFHSYIIKWARDSGIKTAEFQHGAIVQTHHAYNYGDSGFHPDYAAHLPDYLLTHGQFWSDNTRIPAAKVTLGHPHFQGNMDALLAKFGGKKAERGILIVSQGDVTDLMVSLTKSLSSMAPETKITFRLHPAEAAFVERYRELHGIRNVEVSTSGDIYELILTSEYVVGVSSTTLYEAVGLGKPVFVYDTANARFYTPRNFGTWFRDAGELLGLVAAVIPHSQASPEYVWASAWAANYKAFLERSIGIVTAP